MKRFANVYVIMGSDVTGVACVLQHVKPWSWYVEYLFSQGYDGLELFKRTNINRGQPVKGDKDSGTMQL